MAEDYLGVPGLTYDMYVQMMGPATTPSVNAPAATTASAPATTAVSQSPAFTTANIGGTSITAPASFGFPSATVPTSSTVSSTPVTTANIGGTNITAPADFGLPPAPVTPPTPAAPTYTTAEVGGVPITAPADFGLPSQVTGSDYVQQEIDRANQGTTGPTGPTGNVKTYTATDGKTFTDESSFISYQNLLTQQGLAEENKRLDRQSAFDFLKDQFNRYGLGALVEPLRGLVQENISPSEFSIRLRDTDAYKKRFAANVQRTNAGLRALDEAEYIGLEDAYQNVMRRYGMPESYYTPGELGKQSNFEKFIAGDISPAELEDRVQTAQSRVINANPEVAQALRTYYPGITNGDILAYALDTKQAIQEIQRKVTAAEIGGAALQAGLQTGLGTAEGLAKAGVTKEAAQRGYQTIAEILPRGSQLASIYKESPYTQTTAEQEIFGIAGVTEATKQRKKLTQLETAAFSGQTGMGALARDRAGAI